MPEYYQPIVGEGMNYTKILEIEKDKKDMIVAKPEVIGPAIHKNSTEYELENHNKPHLLNQNRHQNYNIAR